MILEICVGPAGFEPYLKHKGENKGNSINVVRETYSPTPKNSETAGLLSGEEREVVDEECSYKGQYQQYPEEGLELLVRLGSS